MTCSISCTYLVTQLSGYAKLISYRLIGHLCFSFPGGQCLQNKVCCTHISTIEVITNFPTDLGPKSFEGSTHEPISSTPKLLQACKNCCFLFFKTRYMFQFRRCLESLGWDFQDVSKWWRSSGSKLYS